MLENKIIRNIHATRYIMSWIRSGGTFDKRGFGYNNFREWLHTLIIDDEPLTEDEIHDIMFIAYEGKLELEMSAKSFLKNK